MKYQMKHTLRLESRGREVKEVQEFLGISADGHFGPKTEAAVKKWQEENGLVADGIVGRVTLGKMGLLDTDISLFEERPESATGLYTKRPYTAKEGLEVTEYFMPTDEYKKGPIKAEWIFLHHTAGWHNPYNVIKAWDADKNGPIATEFVMGGQSVKGNDTQYDGELVQAFPQGNWGYHLGKNGLQAMHVNSVGIEVCNFGYIVKGKTYSGNIVDESQIVTLDLPFRGHKTWHRYSDKQIEVLKKWILWIAERDNIDVRAGLPALVKSKGATAFEYNEDAFYGRIKGLWTHTNTRKDKFDMFPQPELLDMLISL